MPKGNITKSRRRFAMWEGLRRGFWLVSTPAGGAGLMLPGGYYYLIIFWVVREPSL